MPRWKPFTNNYADAGNYIIGRMKGEITSLKTPWTQFNYAGLDGIEWQTMVVIAARPGTFKTALKDVLIQSVFNPAINKIDKIRVLDVQLEMLGRTVAIREFTSIVGRSYKDLCSAGDNPIDKAVLDEVLRYSKHRYENEHLFPRDVIEETLTVGELSETIEEYMETHSYIVETPKGPIKKYCKTVIPIDHSILFDFEGDDLNSGLLRLGKTLTRLKKKYPIIFILLSQLNRNVEKEGRNEPRKFGNYVLTSDIYGGDALLMHADLVVGIDRPFARDLTAYGPPGWIISDAETLVLRWLKARNGENQLTFYKVNAAIMEFVEIVQPPTVRDLGKK